MLLYDKDDLSSMPVQMFSARLKYRLITQKAVDRLDVTVKE